MNTCLYSPTLKSKYKREEDKSRSVVDMDDGVVDMGPAASEVRTSFASIALG